MPKVGNSAAYTSVTASSAENKATLQLNHQKYKVILPTKLRTQNQLHKRNPKNQMSQIPTAKQKLRVRKTRSESDNYVYIVHYNENKDLLIHIN